MISPRDPGYGLVIGIDRYAEHVCLGHELHRQESLDIEQLPGGNHVQQAVMIIDDIDDSRVRGTFIGWQSLRLLQQP